MLKELNIPTGRHVQVCVCVFMCTHTYIHIHTYIHKAGAVTLDDSRHESIPKTDYPPNLTLFIFIIRL